MEAREARDVIHVIEAAQLSARERRTVPQTLSRVRDSAFARGHAAGGSRSTHPLHDGAYSREPQRPAYSIASRLWQAVTPEPHMCTTSSAVMGSEHCAESAT